MTTLAKFVPFARRARKLNCPPDQIENFLRARYIPQPKQSPLPRPPHAPATSPAAPPKSASAAHADPASPTPPSPSSPSTTASAFPGLKCLYLRLQSKQAREQFDDLRRNLLRFIPHRL